MSKSPIIQRALVKVAKQNLKYFPFISITGPRQSGKTTLCHLVGDGFEYINMELDSMHQLAVSDPQEFVKIYHNKVIIDEAQKAPKIFSQLMVHSDARGKNGMYILSGSQNFSLMQNISQSLAGRVAVFSLLPLSIAELYPYLSEKEKNWKTLAIRGFYPRLYKEKKLNSAIFYRSYINTYVERDIKQLINVQDSRVFIQFLKLCAARVGQVMNMQDISQQLGVSGTTIHRWIGILETSYIIYLLPCYYKNFDKRIVKKPKLYFYDTGILSFLLGISSEAQMLKVNKAGAIFENLILMEIMKSIHNRGEATNLYYWADTNGNEVDIIVEDDKGTTAIEVKSTTTPSIDLAKNLFKFQEMYKKEDEKIKLKIAFGGDHSYKQNQIQFLSWRDLNK